jgi:hypothetical protein
VDTLLSNTPSFLLASAGFVRKPPPRSSPYPHKALNQPCARKEPKPTEALPVEPWVRPDRVRCQA